MADSLASAQLSCGTAAHYRFTRFQIWIDFDWLPIGDTLNLSFKIGTPTKKRTVET